MTSVFGIRDGFIDNFTHYFLQGDGFHDLYEGTNEVWAKSEYFPEMVVRRANDFLERNKDAPFFLYFQWQNNWAVREGDWKLIRRKGNRATAKEHFTLHNLADDKPEVTDYVKQRPDQVKQLVELYNQWQKDVFSR